MNDLICVPDHKGKHLKRKSGKVPESCIIPLITAEQYTSRSSMLSALVVAWSPILRLTSVVEETSPSNLFGGCSVLAVGMKSGRISFWRVLEPQCYSSMDGRDSVAVSLIGFLQPHDFWVTAVSWGLHESDVSNPQLLLATGSSNGRLVHKLINTSPSLLPNLTYNMHRWLYIRSLGIQGIFACYSK